MRRRRSAMLAVLGVPLLAFGASAAMREGVRLEADGEPIDIDVGHLVPCVVDWNGDGKKDLVFGQFMGGKIGVYLNRGTDAAPVLKDLAYLNAGGAEISLPAG